VHVASPRRAATLCSRLAPPRHGEAFEHRHSEPGTSVAGRQIMVQLARSRSVQVLFPPGRFRVLVACSHDRTRRSLAASLEDGGYPAIEVASEPALLEVLEQVGEAEDVRRMVHAIVVDIRYGDLSVGTVVRLRNREPLLPIGVIIRPKSWITDIGGGPLAIFDTAFPARAIREYLDECVALRRARSSTPPPSGEETSVLINGWQRARR
jgi:CheY-like chemotaxis protein